MREAERGRGGERKRKKERRERGRGREIYLYIINIDSHARGENIDTVLARHSNMCRFLFDRESRYKLNTYEFYYSLSWGKRSNREKHQLHAIFTFRNNWFCRLVSKPVATPATVIRRQHHDSIKLPQHTPRVHCYSDHSYLQYHHLSHNLPYLPPPFPPPLCLPPSLILQVAALSSSLCLPVLSPFLFGCLS